MAYYETVFQTLRVVFIPSLVTWNIFSPPVEDESMDHLSRSCSMFIVHLLLNLAKAGGSLHLKYCPPFFSPASHQKAVNSPHNVDHVVVKPKSGTSCKEDEHFIVLHWRSRWSVLLPHEGFHFSLRFL